MLALMGGERLVPGLRRTDPYLTPDRGDGDRRPRKDVLLPRLQRGLVVQRDGCVPDDAYADPQPGGGCMSDETPTNAMGWVPPANFLQWKGTDVCIDLHCVCGRSPHYDGEFLNSWRCDG
jgi:hypothetical protein